MLLTQRDNPYPIPESVYNEKNILDYGPARWKRIQAPANMFWNERRGSYMYETGKHREKWVNAKRNAKVGDVVLIRDKNQARLNWPTGTIVEVKKGKDRYVRSATVKPHKRPGSTITERERDRHIQDLGFVEEAPQSSKPDPAHPETAIEENIVSVNHPNNSPSSNEVA